MKAYQICTQCIMDTSDEEIYFDDRGVCSHCLNFENNIKPRWFPNEQGRQRLERLVEKIKADGKNQEFDVIMGLSGGVDSSYVALQAKKLGLRALAIHVDCGWDSELAVKNIENIVTKLGFSLYTQVIDWREIQDLQSSFLQAMVPNLDIPQDHAISASVYAVAAQHNIRYILSGSNIATECILPSSWGHTNDDAKHIRGIHKRFGTVKIKSYPYLGYFKRYLYYKMIKKIVSVKILNFMPYVKEQAIAELIDEVGWRSYGGKHCESLFTKFFQSYYLPKKFGFDKRRAHLSSLIVTGQLTRDEAIKKLEAEVFTPQQEEDEKLYFSKKLGFSPEAFEKIMQSPKQSHLDFPTSRFVNKYRKNAGNIIKMIKSV